MKKLIGVPSCVLVCFLATSVSAQQVKQSVVSAGGGVATAGTVSLEWTLGEPVVEVATSSSYTQGFHQPLIIERKTSPLKPSIYSVSIIPNPVVTQLNVRVGTVTEVFQLRLTDLKGTVVYLGRPTKQVSTTINMSAFKNGTYFLSIIDHSGNQIESFKVIKL